MGLVQDITNNNYSEEIEKINRNFRIETLMAYIFKNWG